jgi:hypothetical protein
VLAKQPGRLKAAASRDRCSLPGVFRHNWENKIMKFNYAKYLKLAEEKRYYEAEEIKDQIEKTKKRLSKKKKEYLFIWQLFFSLWNFYIKIKCKKAAYR